MYTILLVEDDQTIRLATEFALTREGYAVTTAPSGTEALTKYAEAEPDLILLDIMLPGLSGLEVARHIRESDPLTPIIMLTALDSVGDKVTGLDAGADDYLPKPFSATELLARIRANLRRSEEVQKKKNQKVIEIADLVIDKERAEVFVANTPIELRSKEYALLLYLAENPGALATRQMISDAIWHEDFLATSRSIDVHIRQLRKAIDPHSDYTYIQTIHGMGYKFEVIKKEKNPS